MVSLCGLSARAWMLHHAVMLLNPHTSGCTQWLSSESSLTRPTLPCGDRRHRTCSHVTKRIMLKSLSNLRPQTSLLAPPLAFDRYRDGKSTSQRIDVDCDHNRKPFAHPTAPPHHQETCYPQKLCQSCAMVSLCGLSARAWMHHASATEAANARSRSRLSLSLNCFSTAMAPKNLLLVKSSSSLSPSFHSPLPPSSSSSSLI